MKIQIAWDTIQTQFFINLEKNLENFKCPKNFERLFLKRVKKYPLNIDIFLDLDLNFHIYIIRKMSISKIYKLIRLKNFMISSNV